MEFKKEGNMFYLGEDSNKIDAYVSYSIKEDKIYVEHTVVKPELRGQKIAEKLNDRLVEYAREEGYKIVPICPYTVKYFKERDNLKEMLA